jgi:hypothetical protein
MAMDMSYCRFENTLTALIECDEAMAENYGARLTQRSAACPMDRPVKPNFYRREI